MHAAADALRHAAARGEDGAVPLHPRTAWTDVRAGAGVEREAALTPACVRAHTSLQGGVMADRFGDLPVAVVLRSPQHFPHGAILPATHPCPPPLPPARASRSLYLSLSLNKAFYFKTQNLKDCHSIDDRKAF